MRHHQLPQTSQLQQLAEQLCTQDLLLEDDAQAQVNADIPQNTETKEAMREHASPHFSYRSRNLAPEGWPGREKDREGKEEGREWEVILDLFGLSMEIQMSPVLVTDHLTGPRWAERMSCDAKDAPYS